MDGSLSHHCPRDWHVLCRERREGKGQTRARRDCHPRVNNRRDFRGDARFTSSEEKERTAQESEAKNIRAYFEMVARMMGVDPKGVEQEELQYLAINAALTKVKICSLEEWMNEIADQQ